MIWRGRNVPLLLAVAASLVVPRPVNAQASADSRSMNAPVPPFHIIGEIYYVGASDVTSYLIVTPAGDILLDGGFAETAPQIEANIRTLGFQLTDVKILLNSHEHLDHAGGIAELKSATHARFLAMEPAVATLESGAAFPAVTPDRIIHDGDKVELGGVTMVAHSTPGHTPGCTTWTMVTQDHGKPYNVVFVGSASVLPNYKLIDRPGSPATYPGIRADYEKTFRVLKSLPCDVFLAAHGSFYSLTEKRKALSNHPSENPFIDPAGYQAYIARAEAAFRAALQRESPG
ncbi:MAG TPA: subclass B3 metallo-beta-lactamase [Candidatus Aquilonibacter sp.]|nr:subclass B3 metallo-beta-lactamase [Candidatus Aquilonibacter sp.]